MQSASTRLVSRGGVDGDGDKHDRKENGGERGRMSEHNDWVSFGKSRARKERRRQERTELGCRINSNKYGGSVRVPCLAVGLARKDRREGA